VGRMVRKQIVIHAAQERALEDRAAALGISQSALVREALDAFIGGDTGGARKKRAWEELLAGMTDSSRLSVGSRGQRWTREDLHER
jgi:hypothetical protein